MLDLDPARVKDVAVLWLGRIGDLVVSTAFLKSLKLKFPSARVRLVTAAANAQAVPLIPWVDEARLLHRLDAPLSNLNLAGHFASRCDLLIDLNPSFSRLSTVIARLTRAPVKLAFAKGRWDSAFTHRLPAPAEREHMLDRYGRLAAALGAPYDAAPELRLPAAEDALAENLLASLRLSERPGAVRLLVHPGNFKKFDNRWPEDKFLRLSEELQKDPAVSLLYMAGPGEEPQVRRIAGLLRRHTPVLPRASLGVGAAVMRRMDICILNITGTTHVAAAVGARTFGFYSGYTAAVWRPRGPRHEGLVADAWESCRAIPVSAALSALHAIITKIKSEKA